MVIVDGVVDHYDVRCCYMLTRTGVVVDGQGPRRLSGIVYSSIDGAAVLVNPSDRHLIAVMIDVIIEMKDDLYNSDCTNGCYWMVITLGALPGGNNNQEGFG